VTGHLEESLMTPFMQALMKARLFPRDIYREDFFDSADRAAGTNVVRSPLIRR
jgi:phenol hydroxylase P5 protein